MSLVEGGAGGQVRAPHRGCATGDDEAFGPVYPARLFDATYLYDRQSERRDHADGLAFNDNLPPGLRVSTPSTVTGSATEASSSRRRAAVPSVWAAPPCPREVPARSACSSPARPDGTQTNTTGAISGIGASVLVTGDPASATIAVGAALQVIDANVTAPAGTIRVIDPSAGSAYIEFTNGGALGADLFGPGWRPGEHLWGTSTLADEQLIACCSCPVTPNGGGACQRYRHREEHADRRDAQRIR